MRPILGPVAGIVIIIAAWVGGQLFVGEPALVAETWAPPPPVAQTPTTEIIGLTTAAEVTVSAERIVPPTQVTPTVPPPTTIAGLNGMPFAPDGLTNCERMRWYADQAGLPEQFHWIGYEESRCINSASSWCCHGYFQIHEGWVTWAAREAAQRCGVTHKADFDAQTPIARQRNACMAVIVFEKSGFCAWDVVPWCD